MSTELKNPYAEIDFADSCKFITPEEALRYRENGINEFYCPDSNCLDPLRKLSLVASEIRTPHFRHRPEYEHNCEPETLLHKLAIKWFEDREEFEIPANQTQLNQQTLKLNIDETRLEYSRLKTIVPDVLLCTESGFTFAVEIVVTSDVNRSKAKKIEAFNLPTLRISLTSFYYRNKERCHTDLDFINEHLPKLLTDIKLKSWVIFPDDVELPGDIETKPLPVAALAPAPTPAHVVNQSASADNSGCVPMLFLIIGILWLIDRLR